VEKVRKIFSLWLELKYELSLGAVEQAKKWPALLCWQYIRDFTYV